MHRAFFYFFCLSYLPTHSWAHPFEGASWHELFAAGGGVSEIHDVTLGVVPLLLGVAWVPTPALPITVELGYAPHFFAGEQKKEMKLLVWHTLLSEAVLRWKSFLVGGGVLVGVMPTRPMPFADVGMSLGPERDARLAWSGDATQWQLTLRFQWMWSLTSAQPQ